ncbi:hypothetical protein B0J11DRAFT_536438 [Dendryphion nanum]|uniref:Uncharacterized protein n=1 Tax=Dendryphion nanum TaxID=256645 RepID=A0A9P9DE90_9PLEO|nr:hypothetical protein B0J11DRAFT_536438 [Dendryphion nanum]
MAHQAYALPWQTLADNFKFVHANPRYHSLTNLYPCSKPGQGKQLQHFAKVFARVISDYATIERKKYDEEYAPPDHDDDIIISDTTVKNIKNVVNEFMKQELEEDPSFGTEPLLQRDRTMGPWMDVMTWNSCHPGRCIVVMDELLKTLLLYGEMETLFRIAAHPRIRLSKMWTDHRQFAFDLDDYGFGEVKEAALLAYICLNVFFLKPELYDPECRQQMLKEKAKRKIPVMSPEVYDYRLTAAYQQMLVYCTGTGYPYANHGAHKIPHREFYGVPFGMYTSRVHWHDKRNYYLRYGRFPLRDLVDKNFPTKYIPNKSDIPTVINLLHKKNLPTELALQILELADYTSRGRLPVRDDPLSFDNAEELKKYLSYCWKLLVRTEMLLKANGTSLDWEYEVTEVIYKLFGLPYPQMSTVAVERKWVVDDIVPGEVNEGRKRRTFI